MAICWRDGGQDVGDCMPELGKGSCGNFLETSLEFRECIFDGIEVGTVRWEKAKLGA